MKINFTNKEGKSVLEMNDQDDSLVVLDESLKELSKEAKVTDNIQEADAHEGKKDD